MHLKITLARSGGQHTDLLIDVDGQARVGDVATAVYERDPLRQAAAPAGGLTLRVDGPAGPGRIVDADRTVEDAALRSGDVVAVVPTAGRYVDPHDERAAAASLLVTAGPGGGAGPQRIQLRAGASSVGRDPASDVVLADPLVSKRHARINVTDVVEVIDLGSANGVFVNGELVQRAIVRPGEEILLGDTTLVVEGHRAAAAAVESGNTVAFNRSPYLDPRYAGELLKAPQPPQPQQPSRLPYLSLLVPILMGVALFAFTRELVSVVFIALTPLLLLAVYIEQKRENKLNFKEAVARYREALAHLSDTLDRCLAEERESRRREHLQAAQVVEGALARTPVLWCRRPDRHGFCELRTGTAALPTRTVVDMPDTNDTVPELWDELHKVVADHALVPDVPLVASLRDVGVVGVAGPPALALAATRSLLAQVVCLHSPAEVTLAALLPTERAGEWDWLKWLPHTDSAYSPIEGHTLGVGGAGASVVASSLTDLVARRRADRDATTGPPAAGGSDGGHVVVVLVDDDAPVDRRVLVDLAERGPDAGVYLIWVAGAVERLPARAEVFVAIDPRSGGAEAGLIEGGVRVIPVDTEGVPREAMERLARSLAPVVDAGAGRDAETELPSRVSFLDRMGLDLAASPAAVIERWQASDSLPAPAGTRTTPARRRRALPLHAFVGATAHEHVSIDLRAQGPHALVGGTTGAGKSEFLQSWVIGLAANHSPARVTFLFVDYKGGAAFSACTHLPHSVGLVTDLTPHLVTRALRSLNAELRHREHILNRKRAKDVLELEQRGDPECPPSLVIVVDEFAALVAEVPDFVDGMVNVAQRGRSLGLHLILATQRPAGVIRDNLRANTNLRVALRMADDDDSTDVVGSTVAAGFPASLPGRAVLRSGPGRLVPFQSAYVGGWTTGEDPPPPIGIAELRLGRGDEWPEPDAAHDADVSDAGPNDLHRLVEATRQAASGARIEPPRKPWLPELAATRDLSRIPLSRTDRELVFGELDDPDRQRQVPVSYRPDVDGNMAVVGTGGSGKTTFLRTIAVSAGLSVKGGPCHVYGLDFGSRGLNLLESLPHVGSVVAGDDDERVERLLRTLRVTIDERAGRYASVRAGTITEYREIAERPDEPRILLLIDGFPAFRQDYEVGPRMRTFDRFTSIAVDGRQVGVHVVVAVDRVGSIPTSLASMIQRRLVLRLASDNDYTMAGVDGDALAEAPPGRGFLDGYEVQVAVLGGSATTAGQAAAVQALAKHMATGVDRQPAPAVGRLPESVALGSLPATDPDGNPTIGVGDATLGPLGVSLADPLLIAGPPRSGRTTAMCTIAAALRRSPRPPKLVYIGDGRSALATRIRFDQVITTSEGDLDGSLRDLVKRIDDTRAPATWAVFLDDVSGMSSLPEDDRLAEVVERAGRAGQIVVGDGETSALSSTWGVVKALKAARHGLALMPDSLDGDTLFRTPFPPASAVDFPPGRGLYVRSGRVSRMQVAQP